MEIAREMEVAKRWKKLPWGKPEEWMKAMIVGVYKLKNGTDKLVAD